MATAVPSTTKDAEGKALGELLKGVNQAEFVKKNKVQGGASMLSQHIGGNRPISLEAAIVYAAGLNVEIGAFSPRLQKEIERICAFYLKTKSPKIDRIDTTSATNEADWPFDIARERLRVLKQADLDRINIQITAIVETREADIKRTRRAAA